MKFRKWFEESLRIISKAVMIPFASKSSGLSHVTRMDVEERANAVTLLGGPLGAV